MGGIQQAAGEIADSGGFLHKQAKAAISGMPAKATEIEQIATQFDAAMDTNCAKTLALAKSLVPNLERLAIPLGVAGP